jgi:RNA polymerase sigma-70 factor (ECF subfamily)
MERVQTDDTELVRRSRDGDHEAFTELVRRYQDRIFNTAYRFMGERQFAEDITQDVFLKVYHGLARFQEKAAFSTWIYRITLNQCTSVARKLSTRKRKQEVSLTPVSEQGDADPIDPSDRTHNPAEIAEAAERVRVVQEAIATLDVEFREALVLRDIEGFSYEEIADIIERPVGTVRSRIHRARLELREKLRKYVE